VIRRVLVANRGEIAVRILRACRDEGLETVLAVSEADRGSLGALLADRTVCIGPASATESYLDIQRLHFVGLSMGGMIGQTFALKYPGVFSSLTLADTTSRYPAEAAPLWQERIRTAEAKGMEPLVQPTLERWFTAPFREKNADTVRKIATQISTTPVAGYAGCCAAIPKINVTARLKEMLPEANKVRRQTVPAAHIKLALQCGEVGVWGVILQLPGHLCLLGLSTAAPHGSTPSHRNCGATPTGRPRRRQASLVGHTVHGRGPVRHLALAWRVEGRPNSLRKG